MSTKVRGNSLQSNTTELLEKAQQYEDEANLSARGSHDSPGPAQASEDCLSANGRLPWLHDVARQGMQSSRSASPTLSLRDAPAGALSLPGRAARDAARKLGRPASSRRHEDSPFDYFQKYTLHKMQHLLAGLHHDTSGADLRLSQEAMTMTQDFYQDLEALCGHAPDRHVSVAAAMERIQIYQTRLMRKSLAHWQQQLQRIDGFSDTLFSLARTVMSAALEAAMDERDAWHRDKVASLEQQHEAALQRVRDGCAAELRKALQAQETSLLKIHQAQLQLGSSKQLVAAHIQAQASLKASQHACAALQTENASLKQHVEQLDWEVRNNLGWKRLWEERGEQLESLRGELEQRTAQVARYDNIFMEKMEADRRRQAMVGLAAAEEAARLPPPVSRPLPPRPPREPEPVQKPESEVLATRQSSLAAAPSMAPPVPPKKQRLVKPKAQSAAAAAALAGRRAAKLAAEQERQQQIEDEQIEPLFTGTPPAR